jgi:hypothetical protein
MSPSKETKGDKLMPAIRSIAIGILILMLSGCGQLVSERLAVSNSASADNCPITRRLVVLPLADYSYVDDTELALHRNLAIMENLTDQLVSRGYQLPIMEDLAVYLANENIINVVSQPHSLDSEMNKDWSSEMKDELSKMIDADQKNNSTLGQTKVLDQKALAKIASDFNAGYIMRGRIINFELGEENTWNPLKKGLVPVVVGSTTKAVMGVAASEDYDMINQALVGAAIGGAINNNLSTTSISNSSAAWYGAGAGYLSSKSRGNEARVELRLWVQSPETGNVVWTNRVEVKVTPQTVSADTSAKSLFTLAINKATAALVEDFATKMQ